jgi:cell division protease FtsH
VTLIPRGQARGLTWFIPGEDPTLVSKSQIFARIVGALGGRAAEEVVFGHDEVRSMRRGASMQSAGTALEASGYKSLPTAVPLPNSMHTMTA